MRMKKYTEPWSHPGYNEGGGGLGKAFNSITNIATLGLNSTITDALGFNLADPLGIFAEPPEGPKAPKGPDSIQTGQQVAQKSGGSFDENKDAKGNARKTARKGTSQFRIPLANTTTGAKAGGGSGLKI